MKKKKPTKKPANKMATDADYNRMNKFNSEADTKMLEKEMGAKKFTYTGAWKQRMKQKCLVEYKRGRTYSDASLFTGVANRTVYNWFEEFKIAFPLL